MASDKHVLLLFVSFLYSATTEAGAAEPIYIYHNCSTNKTFTANSPFQLDQNTLLSSLASNATGNTEFYNTTVTGRNLSDTVYGLFMCRGDVPRPLCRECVVKATQGLSSDCRLSKEAIIWYDECLVRYSNRSFFSTVDTRPRVGMLNTANVSRESYLQVSLNILNVTADNAANAPLGAKKVTCRQARILFSSSVHAGPVFPRLSKVSKWCDWGPFMVLYGKARRKSSISQL